MLQFDYGQIYRFSCHVYHYCCHDCQCVRTAVVPGDGIDNDCDGKIDEEVRDGKDDDNDGEEDEDLELVS